MLQIFLEHALSINTDTASRVVNELVADNRQILDSLVANYEFGFGWLIKQFTGGVIAVDDKIIDLLTAFCVCEKKAVREAQVCIHLITST